MLSLGCHGLLLECCYVVVRVLWVVQECLISFTLNQSPKSTRPELTSNLSTVLSGHVNLVYIYINQSHDL